MLKRTLYFGSPCYLSKEHQQLKVRDTNSKSGKHLGQIPVEDIGVVVLDHPQITITAPLLLALTENNAVLLTCNEKHLPAAMLQPLYRHTTHTKNLREQLSAKLPFQKQLWTQTVKAKIANQASLLRECHANDAPLMRWGRTVKSGDPDNVEARAAAYYWANYQQAYSADKFVRDRYGESPNNCLNYGYAILRALVARALVASGLHPAYGIFHKNKYNPYCLADDVMEPYRPYVDATVLEIMKTYPSTEDLSREVKAELLSISKIDVKINNRTSPLEIAVQRTSASLAACFRGERTTILYPKRS